MPEILPEEIQDLRKRNAERNAFISSLDDDLDDLALSFLTDLHEGGYVNEKGQVICVGLAGEDFT